MDARDEEERLRSVALQNAQSILAARQRAEEELLAAKEALRDSEQRLRAIIRRRPRSASPSPGSTAGSLETNRKFVEILGYSRGELNGRTVSEHHATRTTWRARSENVRRLLGRRSRRATRTRSATCARTARRSGRFTSVDLLNDAAGPPAAVHRRDRGHHRAQARRGGAARGRHASSSCSTQTGDDAGLEARPRRRWCRRSPTPPPS